MIRNKTLQERIYGKEMTAEEYKNVYLNARYDWMVTVSNDPKIDNVWDYYLTREQVRILNCFWRVLVKKEQAVIWNTNTEHLQ